MKKIPQILYYLICFYIVSLLVVDSNLKVVGKVPDFTLISILTVYIVYVLINKENRKKLFSNLKNFSTSFLGVSMIILVITMLFSMIYSAEKGLALKETFRFLTYVALIFIIKYEVKERENIENIIKCFVYATIILCVYGIVQYFTKFGLEAKFIYLNETRITATMENPNGFGAYLVLSFFPIFMLTFNEKNKRNKSFYIITSVLIVINIFLTYSRNATVGFMIGILALAFLYNYKFLSVFFIFVPIVLFDRSLINRFSNIKISVLNDPRIKLWKVAGKMIKENPILGVGNGNYVALYDEYIEKYPELKYKDYHRFSSHNSYLKIQSELGVLGIFSFALVIISSITSVIKVYKNSNNKMYKLFFMGVMASSIAFLAMNFLDNLFFSPQTTTYFWLFIALSESVLYNDLKMYK